MRLLLDAWEDYPGLADQYYVEHDNKFRVLGERLTSRSTKPYNWHSTIYIVFLVVQLDESKDNQFQTFFFGGFVLHLLN